MDARRPRRPRDRTYFETRLGRRRFLYLVGGAAAYAALRPHAAWARKAAKGEIALQPWTLPADPPADPVALTRTLIGAAVLAPSKWNSQPWRFEVEGPSIRVVADPRRTLPITDPERRGMMISLGAALENLLVTARAYGLRPTADLMPGRAGRDVVAEVSWTTGEARRDRGMLSAIPERRTNRREFDGRGVFQQNHAQLAAQVPEGFRLHWMDESAEIEAVADIARAAERDLVTDARAQSERYGWMRFGEDEARRRGDGVTVDELEVGGPVRWLAGRCFDPESWFLRFGAQSASKQVRSAFRSAGALALLTSVSGRGESQWLMGGQAYERIALKATQVGIAHQPVNAAIDLEKHRPQILRRFGAAGEEPLMLVRFGHAKRPHPSVRRSAVLVSSFRNS
jgi:hypothetical protein